MDAELASILASDFAQAKLKAEAEQQQLRSEIDTLKKKLKFARSNTSSSILTKSNKTNNKDQALATTDLPSVGEPKTKSGDSLQQEQQAFSATRQTSPNIKSAWNHFCLMYCHLTWWQQMGSWVVLVAGVLLPFLSSPTKLEGQSSSIVSFFFSSFRGIVFVFMALIGYQGMTVVMHAKEQIVALEKNHK
jgi:hypothetical protein